MASFTETVERRNPALTATGLAVWGLVIRIVIAVSVFIVPHVVNTVTTLVDKGATVQQYAAGEDPALTADENATVKAVAADPTIVPKAKQLSHPVRDRAGDRGQARSRPRRQRWRSPRTTRPRRPRRSASSPGSPVADVATVLSLASVQGRTGHRGRQSSTGHPARPADRPDRRRLQAKAVGEIAASCKYHPGRGGRPNCRRWPRRCRRPT